MMKLAYSLGVLGTLLASYLTYRAPTPSSTPRLDPMSARAPEPHFLRVTTLTDVVSPVPGNKLMISQGGQSRVYLTDAKGVGPEVSIGTGIPASITLKEKTISGGTCVGQVYDYSCNDLGTGNPVYQLLTVFQPQLEPTILDSQAPHFVQGQHHDRWAFNANENSDYLLSANVGLLVTPREIQAFRRYYDLQFAHDDYRMGLVIRTTDPEEFGGEGARMQLRFDTYGFTDLPGVDPYFVAASPADLGVADFDVLPVSWEPGFGEVAYYDILGTLGKGMNVLLFREGDSSDLVELVARPPLFHPLTRQQQLDPVYVASSTEDTPDCTPTGPKPPEPTGAETCPLISPGDDEGCAVTDCGSATPQQCVVTFTKVGGPLESDASGVPGTKSFTVTTTITGGVSVSFKVDDTGVTVSGGASKSSSETVSMTVGPGAHGCGQIAQAYKRTIQCEKTCVVHRDQYLFGVFLIYTCVDTMDIAMCLDTEGTYIAGCNKTGCQ